MLNHPYLPFSERGDRCIIAGPRFFAALTLTLLWLALAQGQAKRIVIIKVDGLPADLVDRFVREIDPRTGKSQLPWIEHVFYERGTRVANFYVRGMSLSGPSWSLLETGQHLQIKGNVEFDRLTLHSYDYLNFIPFYIESAFYRRVDMPGPEVLDEVGLPLLIDAYPYDERSTSFQLYQRGIRWDILKRALQNRLTTRGPRELVDEWATGIEARNIVSDQLERELIENLRDPRIRYLDYYTTEFDHRAHHNRDRASHLYALQELDATVGRVWTAMQRSPEAADTALIMVSDHGFNTDERVYSQGYNLVTLLSSAGGGGHHVITKRRPMMDYSLKGVYPLVSLITTSSSESYYLKGRGADYPTALLDFDGNERASIHLRDSDLNVLQILLQELRRTDVAGPLRQALTDAFFRTLDGRREGWETELTQLNEELGALRRAIEKQREMVEAQPKKWTQADKDAGRDKESRRLSARLNVWLSDEQKYRAYVRTLANLTALKRQNFDPAHLRIEDLIPKGSMADRNTIHELQNYVAGVAPGGFVMTGDGSLDMWKSFARVDYFSLLGDVTVINNVQAGVSNHPVDFVATRIPREVMRPVLENDLRPDGDVLWVYGGPERQALILSREDGGGRLSLRYVPISGLTQDANGAIQFKREAWRAGLPLKIWEDKDLNLAGESRAAWLNDWHTDLEWLNALHKTEYSNALVGLHEQLTQHQLETLSTDIPGLTLDERLLRRFRQRRRGLVETDLLVLANNHWNFDVRGFNPGGNHGSFFRISTHATLMFAGGERTGIPRASVVEEPYDSLSFVPTVLALTGELRHEQEPVQVLWDRGFRRFPGRIIQEVVNGTIKERANPPVAEGVGSAH